MIFIFRNNIQRAGVQYIIDSVIQELIKDPARRYACSYKGQSGGIPYTAHGAQITPFPLFFIFVHFLFLCLF